MMSGNQSLFIIVMLASVLVSSISQVLLKIEALKKHESVANEYLNPLVIGAYCLFFLSTLLTVFAYQGIPLSLGPALEATSYIYVALFGAVLFHEAITVRKVIALLLIVGGIVCYACFA